MCLKGKVMVQIPAPDNIAFGIIEEKKPEAKIETPKEQEEEKVNIYNQNLTEAEIDALSTKD